jgi:hypothetical protein
MDNRLHVDPLIFTFLEIYPSCTGYKGSDDFEIGEEIVLRPFEPAGLEIQDKPGLTPFEQVLILKQHQCYLAEWKRKQGICLRVRAIYFETRQGCHVRMIINSDIRR